MLFINLLIAMFNDTYRKITEHSDEEWKMNRAYQTQAYIVRYPVPPPLNVLFLMFELLYLLYKKARSLYKNASRSAVEIDARVSGGALLSPRSRQLSFLSSSHFHAFNTEDAELAVDIARNRYVQALARTPPPAAPEDAENLAMCTHPHTHSLADLLHTRAPKLTVDRRWRRSITIR